MSWSIFSVPPRGVSAISSAVDGVATGVARRAAGILTIIAMGYLTYLGASAGSPNEIDMKVAKKYEAGKLVMAQSGCLACHKVGENVNDGPGPHLTDIADKLPKAAIRRTLENPTAPMPSYAGLPENKKAALVDFLAQLHGKSE